MSIHINKFIDKIKSLESKNAKQMTMTIREAKDLHGDITKILLALQDAGPSKKEEVIKVDMDGGSF